MDWSCSCLAAREQTAITQMLPWLPYVYCTKLNPSSGQLALNGEKSCLLESAADPFAHLAALSSGVLCLLYNERRSRTAARHHAMPNHILLQHPPSGIIGTQYWCGRNSPVKAGKEQRACPWTLRNTLALDLCVLAWLKEQSFFLPVWTESIEWNIKRNNLGALGPVWWLYRFLIEQQHWLLKGVLYTDPQHVSKYNTRTSRQPSVNSKIANCNRTARRRDWFSFTNCFAILKIFIFFKGSFLQGIASTQAFKRQCKAVFAAVVGRDSAACKYQDLQEKQEIRSWEGSKRLKSSPSDGVFMNDSPD